MTSASSSSRRIGFLYPGRRDGGFDQWRPTFVEALKELGWTEGGNLVVEWRFAEYNHKLYSPLAADLARQEVDALVVAGTPLTRALQQATRSIPIVTGVGDPVGSGFAASLERPGGNIAGLSWALRDKASRQIALLLEMAPTVRSLLILRSQQYGDIADLNSCLEAVARGYGLKAEIRTAASFAEIDAALGEHDGPLEAAAMFYVQGTFQFDITKLAEAAIRHRVATVGDERGSVEAGCLMSYSLSFPDQVRSFATVIDQILRGANPADLSFQLPTKSELILNRSTAASLGLVLPPGLLRRADAVIG